MPQNVINLLVRGERPTRADPFSVRKPLPALRQVTGRGARTRAGPRGVVSRWSGRGEILRLRVVASQDSALVRSMRVAWRVILRRRRNVDGLSPSRTGRAYRDRGSRKPSLMTVGTLTSQTPEWSGGKRGGISYAKSVLGDGGAVGFSAFFGGLSISRVRPGGRPLAVHWSAACGKTSMPRGVTVVEDET